MDENKFTQFENLGELIPSVPPESILSRTFFQDSQMRAILFSFAQGQELSQHTASVPAILHFLEGEANVTLGEQPLEAHPGSWFHMTAELPHSIYAKTPVKMLLLMLFCKYI